MKDFILKDYEEIETREELLKYIDDLKDYIDLTIGSLGSTDKREKFRFLEARRVKNPREYISKANDRAENFVLLVKQNVAYQQKLINDNDMEAVQNENIFLKKSIQDLKEKIKELENQKLINDKIPNERNAGRKEHKDKDKIIDYIKLNKNKPLNQIQKELENQGIKTGYGTLHKYHKLILNGD